jgi:hypothetical protein
MFGSHRVVLSFYAPQPPQPPLLQVPPGYRLNCGGRVARGPRNAIALARTRFRAGRNCGPRRGREYTHPRRIRKDYPTNAGKRCATLINCLNRRIGWGGRIRTFTGLINSEVPYQLDHAPVASAADLAARHKVGSATKGAAEGLHKITRSPESRRKEKCARGLGIVSLKANVVRKNDRNWQCKTGNTATAEAKFRKFCTA